MVKPDECQFAESFLECEVCHKVRNTDNVSDILPLFFDDFYSSLFCAVWNFVSKHKQIMYLILAQFKPITNKIIYPNVGFVAWIFLHHMQDNRVFPKLKLNRN